MDVSQDQQGQNTPEPSDRPGSTKSQSTSSEFSLELKENSHDNSTELFPDQQKFLIVEDDLMIQPIWERILALVDPNAVVFWTTSEEGAETLIRQRIDLKDEFDFVVADVMLEGPKNGVDLWKRFGRGNTLFLFASSITPVKLQEMIGDARERYPFLIRKPLDPVECIESMRAMLSYRGAFTQTS